MSGTSTDPRGRSAADIEDDVERTRANVSETLGALRGRLEPGQIVDQVVDRVAEYARGSGGAEFARNLGAALRDNPLPVVLIGAGIGWLLLSNNQRDMMEERGPSYSGEGAGSRISRHLADGTERVSGALDAARGRIGETAEAVGDAASTASSYVSQAASRAAEFGSDVASRVAGAEGRAADSLRAGMDAASEEVWRGAHGLAESVQEWAEAQPLLLGAVGFALGAGLGAALPRTRTEDHLLGEARDAVVSRVSAASAELGEELQSVAGEHLGQVRESVARNLGRVKDEVEQRDLGQGVRALGEAGGEIARSMGEAVTGVASHVARKVEGEPPPGQA